MKRLLLTLALATLPAIGFGQDEATEYKAHKLVKQKAENACLVLANISLHPSDYRALAIHTEPRTKGVVIPSAEGYHIATFYKYRADGIAFYCIFRDWRDGGLIQLVEFGHMNTESGEETITRVTSLF